MNASSRTRILLVGITAVIASLAVVPPCAHAQIDFDEVQTIAGPANSDRGRVDAAGSAARFDFPSGVVVDPAGDLFVTDKGNSNAVRRITPAGEVTTFAGGNFLRGHADGTGTAAQFAGPEAIARHPSGDLYVADTRNHVIRRITPAAEVTTFVGTPRTAGYADGTGAAARFFSPSGIVIDSVGVIFVADQINHVIRRISPAGEVTTFVGLAGVSGSNDGTGSIARFTLPENLAIDPFDNLYVTEIDEVQVAATIRKITPAGVVTTLAGSRGLSGTADGVGAAARFDSPVGMVADADGYLYVSDGNARIRRISPAGEVLTVVGQPSLTSPGSRPTYGVLDGPIASAWIKDPRGLAFDASNNLIIVQHDPSAIRRATAVVPGGPVITTQPQDRLTIPTTTVLFEVTATSSASQAFTYQWERAPAGSSAWTPITEDATYGLVTPRMLVVRDTTLAMSGDRFRCIVSNGLPDDAISDAATLTVQVANQAITFPPMADRTYGDAPVILGASASSGLPVFYTVVSGPARLVSGTVELTGAGAVTVRAAQAGDGVAITPAVDVERTFLVAKKELVAMAVDATRARGFSNPVLTVSYTGFVGTDSATVLDTPPVAATAAVPASPAGTYPITLSGGSDDNYTFDLRAGTLSVVPGYTVRTWAGPRAFPADGWQAGAGAAARPAAQCIALDASGEMYAGSAGVISRISRDAVVTLFAGSPDSLGHVDGPRLDARFDTIRHLFFEPTGRLLIVDQYEEPIPGGGFVLYFRLRALTSDGQVTTLWDSKNRQAGEPNIEPHGPFIMDSQGRIFGLWAGLLNRLTLDTGAQEFIDLSTREGALSPVISSLAIDASDNFYIAELNGDAIWKVSPAGEISLFSGMPGDARRLDGPRLAARFEKIQSLGVAPDGSLWVGDDTALGIGGPAVVRRISPDGLVVSIAGDTSVIAAGIEQVDGTGDAARLREPDQFVFRDDGVAFWNDVWGRTISAAVEVAEAPRFTTEPEDRTLLGATSTTFHASAIGRPPPGYQWQRSTDGGANWDDLVDDATYADVTGPTLTVRGLDASMDGLRFRVVADNAVAPPAVSRAAILRVVGSGGSVFTGGFSASGATATARPARTRPALAAEGEWALFVGGEGTARFIARLPGGAEAIVQAFSVAADGTFSAPGRTILFRDGAREPGDAYALTGSITGGVLSGQLDGLGLVFGGVAFPSTGPTAAFAAHYSAVGLGAGLSELHVVVAPDGTARVLLLGRDGLDGGNGTLTPEGVLSAVLDSGATVVATVDLGTFGIRASVTSTGPGAQAVEFAGLSALGRARSRVVNLSARTRTDSGDRVSIIGFVLKGAGTRRLLIRGVGPTLGDAPFGVAGVLADPRLALYDATGTPALAIDDWGERGDGAELTAAGIDAGAFALPIGSADAAALVDLGAGAYTAIMSGADAAAGVVLGELYALDEDGDGPDLVNLSSRAFVGAGSAVAIPGIVSTGNVPRRFLIRAVGPTLAGQPFAVGESLSDPLLRVYRSETDGGSTLLFSNDDWGAGPDAATTAQVAQQVGAFALTPGGRDAALVLALAPGVYTIHGASADGTSTGVILVEVYLVP